MSRTWEISGFLSGDRERILALRQDVFGDADPVRTRARAWDWQFEKNPAGKMVCCLARVKERVVGQYAVIPTRLWKNGEPLTAAFSCDTMVHPDFQRQGMFTALAEKVYQEVEKTFSLPLVWGFPNASSMPGFLGKLQWKQAGGFPTWLAPPGPGLLMAPITKFCIPIKTPALFEPLPGVRMERISRFGPEFDRLWEKHAPGTGIIQVTDALYLNWRYFGLEEFGYQVFSIQKDNRLEGFIVLRSLAMFGLKAAVLVDCFPLPVVDDAVLSRLVKKLRVRSWRTGHAAMVGLFPHKHGNTARKCGFFKVPEKLSPKSWDLGCRALKQAEKALFNAENWHITLGDTDIV